jgi:hypothetical protein
MSDESRLTSQVVNWGLFLLGVILLAVGLVFLIAAIQKPTRLLVALALFVPGAGLAAWVGIRWRRARQLSPSVLDGRIIELAAANDGEITQAQIMSTLDVPDAASRAALARLEAEGQCRQEKRKEKTVFVFAGLKESKVFRRCAYCGSNYSVREPLHKCPNCGGDLEIVKA